jgi:NADH-quinone oxidoreductase subunit F
MIDEKDRSRTEVDLAPVDDAVAECGRAPGTLIRVLQKLQKHYRYLPEAALRRVCELMDVAPASLVGVATFYSQFRHKPVGRHLVSVCHGTACHIKGATLVHEALRRHLKIEDGADTDPGGVFTLEKVGCLGCCTLAPVMRIDGVTYGRLTPDKARRALSDFLALEKKGVVPARRVLPAGAPAGQDEIRIGVGSCCVAGGSMSVMEELESAVRKAGAGVGVKPVGCVGMCHQTPLVQVVAGGETVTYSKVRPEDAAKIVRRHFKPAGILRRIRTGLEGAVESLLTDEAWEPVDRYLLDVRDAPVCSFLGRQRRIASEWCGSLNPLDLDEYLRHDGFAAMRKCLAGGNPEAAIEIITRAKLRGRGGAGYSTGRKWAVARGAAGSRKYIVCNGDEGDPGAFMDRMLLESFPYRVLEGMVIAAHAVNATEGFLYIRTEYPLALSRIREAMAVMERRGFLGPDICNSGFGLRLVVVEGAGAFVSGEETALMEAIEGRRSMPRFRPPFPAESGLWGQPTSINNVETYAMVPWIIRNGPEAFAALGTASSKGTKVFSLAGKVARGGLIEVPMGITINEIVREIGGGVPGGKMFKAVQIGGPSGGCIPAALGETRVDYEELEAIGCIMGSGGIVVLDGSDCMVDIARYFMTFTQSESCGKCAPCRVGTRLMLEILERLCGGRGRPGDIERLEQLGRAAQSLSLCGLGRTAPNPVLSTIRHFRDEYEAHIAGRCPAGKCRALISYSISDDCIGCTRCAQACPADAIELAPYRKHEIKQELCTRCDTCRRVCPSDAVKIGPLIGPVRTGI